MQGQGVYPAVPGCILCTARAMQREYGKEPHGGAQCGHLSGDPAGVLQYRRRGKERKCAGVANGSGVGAGNAEWVALFPCRVHALREKSVEGRCGPVPCNTPSFVAISPADRAGNPPYVPLRGRTIFIVAQFIRGEHLLLTFVAETALAATIARPAERYHLFRADRAESAGCHPFCWRTTGLYLDPGSGAAGGTSLATTATGVAIVASL